MGGARDTVGACAQGQRVREGRREHAAPGSDTVSNWADMWRCSSITSTFGYKQDFTVTIQPRKKKKHKTVFKHF